MAQFLIKERNFCHKSPMPFTLSNEKVLLDQKLQCKIVECYLKTKLMKLITNDWMKIYNILKYSFGAMKWLYT
jgi:hypothetical protein